MSSTGRPGVLRGEHALLANSRRMEGLVNPWLRRRWCQDAGERRFASWGNRCSRTGVHEQVPGPSLVTLRALTLFKALSRPWIWRPPPRTCQSTACRSQDGWLAGCWGAQLDMKSCPPACPAHPTARMPAQMLAGPAACPAACITTHGWLSLAPGLPDVRAAFADNEGDLGSRVNCLRWKPALRALAAYYCACWGDAVWWALQSGS